MAASHVTQATTGEVLLERATMPPTVELLKKAVAEARGISIYRHRILKGTNVLEDATLLEAWAEPVCFRLVVLPYAEEAGAVLTQAVVGQDLEAVKKALHAPANPNHWDSNTGSDGQGYDSDLDDFTPGLLSVVTRSVAGGEVDYEDDHLLDSWGSISITNALLQARADPNFVPAGGVPALCQAAKYGNVEAACALLAAGADANIPDPTENRETPLHLATGLATIRSDARRRCVEMMRILCAAGACVNIVDETGRAPLHIATGCPRGWYIEKGGFVPRPFPFRRAVPRSKGAPFPLLCSS